MMEYIVDPSWVYWMNVADAVKIAALVGGGTFTIMSIIATPIFLDCGEWKDVKKWAMPFMVAAVVLLLAGIFIPSKQTLIAMKVAEMATKENVTMTAQQLKEIVDYIINAVKELK